jgi:hypothetical protein
MKIAPAASPRVERTDARDQIGVINRRRSSVGAKISGGSGSPVAWMSATISASSP